MLSQVKLIAEPWDIGPDGYQVGRFPPPFAEWNDQFRDTARRYWLHVAQGQVDVDGRAMAAPGQRKKMLSQYTDCTMSIDGYNAHLLQKGLKQLQKKKFNHMVVIGHPKALSRYSIIKLEEFIAKNKEKNNFTSFTKEFLKKRF